MSVNESPVNHHMKFASIDILWCCASISFFESVNFGTPLPIRPNILYGDIEGQRQVIFTAHKRSLGQGNVFTPAYHSVHGGGGLPPGGSASGGLPRWVCLQGGSASGGGADPLELGNRVVRILLECFLVNVNFLQIGKLSFGRNNVGRPHLKYQTNLTLPTFVVKRI